MCKGINSWQTKRIDSMQAQACPLSNLILLPNLHMAHHRLSSTQAVWTVQQVTQRKRHRDTDPACRGLAAHLVAQHLQPLPVLHWQKTDARNALLYALDHLHEQQ
jgi:hypothetical protein